MLCVCVCVCVSVSMSDPTLIPFGRPLVRANSRGLVYAD